MNFIEVNDEDLIFISRCGGRISRVYRVFILVDFGVSGKY